MNTQEQKIIDQAIEILNRELANDQITFNNPKQVIEFLTLNLAQEKSEVFGVAFLNNQHQVIEFRKMFFGTINAASVHPREVVKACIETNAAAAILSHNHPSGVAEASVSDIEITRTLKDILAIIDVRVLDHVIIAGTQAVSLAERGQV